MGLVWSKCPRCHLKFFDLDLKLDFIDGKRYCDNCLREIREERVKEEARRKEEESRKAVEEYQAKKRQEAEQREARKPVGFKTRTLTQKEYESLDPDLKEEYLIDSIQEEEAESLREEILSQPKSKIIEIYNQWAFCLYRKRQLCIIECLREKVDELEKQVYEKEFSIIQSCKSMNEFRAIMNQLPHCQTYDDPRSSIYVERNDLYDGKNNYSWPRVYGVKGRCTDLLSKEENLLYRAFQIFKYNTENNWTWRFHPQWNEYCDCQYNRYIQKKTEEAEKEAEKLASFKQFLAENDSITPAPFLENEKQDTVKSDEPGTGCPVLTVNKESDPVKAEEEQEAAKPDEPEAGSPATADKRENNTEKKAKKPRRIDTGNTLFSAKWKSIE